LESQQQQKTATSSNAPTLDISPCLSVRHRNPHCSIIADKRHNKYCRYRYKRMERSTMNHFILLSLVVSTGGFTTAPSLLLKSAQVTTTAEHHRLLPTSLTIDLPSWLVENGNTAFDKLDTFAASLTQQRDQLSVPTLASPTLSWESISGLLTTTPLRFEQLASQQIDPTAFSMGPFSALLTTPWHVEAIAAFGLANALMLYIKSPDNLEDAPYDAGTSTYDPEAAAEFYSKRPLLVAKRILKLGLLTSAFNAGVLFDWLVLGKLLKDEEYTALRKAEPRRAKAALNLCENLGPTFIKLG
jgi:hypothetical protein